MAPGHRSIARHLPNRACRDMNPSPARGRNFLDGMALRSPQAARGPSAVAMATGGERLASVTSAAPQPRPLPGAILEIASRWWRRRPKAPPPASRTARLRHRVPTALNPEVRLPIRGRAGRAGAPSLARWSPAETSPAEPAGRRWRRRRSCRGSTRSWLRSTPRYPAPAPVPAAAPRGARSPGAARGCSAAFPPSAGAQGASSGRGGGGSPGGHGRCGSAGARGERREQNGLVRRTCWNTDSGLRCAGEVKLAVFSLVPLWLGARLGFIRLGVSTGRGLGPASQPWELGGVSGACSDLEVSRTLASTLASCLSPSYCPR